MKRRIFIAINLPESVKKRLVDFRQKWEYLLARHSLGDGGAVRWTKKESLHLTLVFIGYVDEDDVYKICKLARQVAQKREPFSLEFQKILYGPPGKPPRLIWLQGQPSAELSGIKTELENAFMGAEGLKDFRAEKRVFAPHITLARTKMGNWHRLPDLQPARQEAIEQEFKAIISVASIEVMESDLKHDGAEYVILESCPLGN